MDTRPGSAADGEIAFFAQHGYAVIRGAISRADARRYETYALMNRQHPGYYRQAADDRGLSRYADVLGESLQAALAGTIARQTGLSLLPCHATLRICLRGASLACHLDDPDREVSAVLTLGGQAEETWPLWLRDKHEDKAVVLPPGDMLVYRGSQLEHWREALTGEYWVQLCMRFVTAGGHYAHCRYDGRRGLGEPENRDQQDRFIELRRDYDASLAAGENRPCFCDSGETYSRCHGVRVQVPGA